MQPLESEPSSRAGADDARAITHRTAQHELWLFAESASFWEHLETVIEQAREVVWLSTYIYRAADRLGKAFGELLARAAERGADVRLLYDPQGSRGVVDDDFAAIRARGVQVRSYRRYSFRKYRFRYFPRDHGRLLIVDEAAFTGGVNWGDEWLPAAAGGGDWHDAAIGVVGPCVADFRHAFRLRWAEALSARRVSDHHSPEDADVQLIADSPSSYMLIFDQLCKHVNRARRRVWFENAYCIPPRPLLRALKAASARGVDVRLMLPGVTDLPIVRTITRGEYRDWLAGGIQVFEYGPRVLHSKFVVIDDDWCTIGSFNATTPGLWWANETNVVVLDRPFTQALATVFLNDLEHCHRIETPRDVVSPARAVVNYLASVVYRLVEWCGTHLAELLGRVKRRPAG